MGILIKDMQMPKGNDAITIIIFPNGKVSLAHDRWFAEYAEAVPVPAHGRLVDARYIRDAIIQKWMDKAGDSHMYKCGMEDAYEVIRNAPTIIPAEPLNEEVNE